MEFPTTAPPSLKKLGHHSNHFWLKTQADRPRYILVLQWIAVRMVVMYAGPFFMESF